MCPVYNIRVILYFVILRCSYYTIVLPVISVSHARGTVGCCVHEIAHVLQSNLMSKHYADEYVTSVDAADSSCRFRGTVCSAMCRVFSFRSGAIFVFSPCYSFASVRRLPPAIALG